MPLVSCLSAPQGLFSTGLHYLYLVPKFCTPLPLHCSVFIEEWDPLAAAINPSPTWVILHQHRFIPSSFGWTQIPMLSFAFFTCKLQLNILSHYFHFHSSFGCCTSYAFQLVFNLLLPFLFLFFIFLCSSRVGILAFEFHIFCQPTSFFILFPILFHLLLHTLLWLWLLAHVGFLPWSEGVASLAIFFNSYCLSFAAHMNDFL